MATMKALYEGTNAAWPAEVPPLTDWEAVRAASRLWRWGRGVACPYEIRATSGNRYSYVRGGVLHVNPDKGWRLFIHDLSHTIDMESKAHSKHHARFETKMIKEVLKRGWLDGRLKREEAPAPTSSEAHARELARIAAAEKRWNTKAKRAATALKKLAQRRRYVERRASAAVAP